MQAMSTNSSAHSRSRIPEGVPAGGQFATERRGESTTSTLARAAGPAPAPYQDPLKAATRRANTRQALADYRRNQMSYVAGLRALRAESPGVQRVTLGRHERDSGDTTARVIGMHHADGTSESFEVNPYHHSVSPALRAGLNHLEDTSWEHADSYAGYDEEASEELGETILYLDVDETLAEGVPPRPVEITRYDPLREDASKLGAWAWQPVVDPEAADGRYSVSAVDFRLDDGTTTRKFVGDRPEVREAIFFEETQARQLGER